MSVFVVLYKKSLRKRSLGKPLFLDIVLLLSGCRITHVNLIGDPVSADKTHESNEF